MIKMDYSRVEATPPHPIIMVEKWPIYPGLFTIRGCSSGEEVTHEVVVNYCEWAATKTL